MKLHLVIVSKIYLYCLSQSVHLFCLNSCYTNLAQCIKIPIENNENSVSK